MERKSIDYKIGLRTEKKLLSVIGAQWGDEGKGKIVDSLASSVDIVARFNGGANAGHTIHLNGKKFSFHALPCGVLYKNVKNVIGNGTVLDYKSLTKELDILKNEGIFTEKNVLISNKAHIVFEFHKIMDNLIEKRKGTSKIGTTKKGIGPCYSQKAARIGLRTGDLVENFETFSEKYLALLNYTKKTFNFKFDGQIELKELKIFRERVSSLVTDTSYYCSESLKKGKSILAEGANATMLDLDFGTYPFVTSSHTMSPGIFCGLGIPPMNSFCIGVVKAYTTRVGCGPFPTELNDSTGEIICEEGKEYGTTTGRKRRVGWIDIPLLKYSNRLNGFNVINLTKLDVLSVLDEIKIGTKYLKNKVEIPENEFPNTIESFNQINVKYETMKGWKKKITNTKSFETLPIEAQNYIKRVEQLLGVPIKWIGVGTNRHSFICR